MRKLPCLTHQQMRRLIEAAEQVALRFCSPVYLVGSAVSNRFPNDIDIYVACDGDTYLRLFTNYGRLTESEKNHLKNMKAMQVQQAKIIKKQKKYFCEQVKGWDFDVKFQVKDSFLKHEGKRVRLDVVYEGVW